MPRKDEPRVMVRLSQREHDLLKGMADRANVSLGGLLRECALKYGAATVRDALEGSVRIRRAKAVEAVRGQVAPASSLVVSNAPDKRELDRQRQARLNAEQQRRAAKR